MIRLWQFVQLCMRWTNSWHGFCKEKWVIIIIFFALCVATREGFPKSEVVLLHLSSVFSFSLKMWADDCTLVHCDVHAESHIVQPCHDFLPYLLLLLRGGVWVLVFKEHFAGHLFSLIRSANEGQCKGNVSYWLPVDRIFVYVSGMDWNATGSRFMREGLEFVHLWGASKYLTNESSEALIWFCYCSLTTVWQ